MRKIWKLVIGGIETKIFNLVLVTAILILVAFVGVTFYSSNQLTELVQETNTKQTEAIRKTSTDTIHGIIYDGLATDNMMEAMIVDMLFQDHVKAISMLGEYAQMLYDDPDHYARGQVEVPKPGMDGTACAQVLFQKVIDQSDPALIDEMGLLANLNDMLVSIYSSFPEVGSCFIGTASGVLLMADDTPSTKILDDGSFKTIEVTERPWFQGAGMDGEIFFTEIEEDSFTDRIGVVCAKPIYQDGKLVAVVGTDFYLNDMREEISASGSDSSQFIFIINGEGHVIFSPKTKGILSVQTAEAATDLRESTDEELAAFITQALQGATEVTMVHMEGEGFYMAGSPLPSTGWALISVIPENTADLSTQQMLKNYRIIQTEAVNTFRDNIKQSKTTIIVLVVTILLFTTAGAVTLGQKIADPIRKMTEKIVALGKKEGEDADKLFRMEDTYKTGDEIEILAKSFADISEKTIKYVEEVKQVTAEKERIGAELTMATDIQESQLPHIFPPYPDVEEFDLYASMNPAKEVGGDFYDFFLIDRNHLGMVMADVSGKGVPAALFMMISKTLIKNRLLSGDSPAQALDAVNRQLLDGNDAGMFVTVWLAVLDLSTGKGIAANAGHEHPALKRAGGEYELIKYRHNPAAATFDDLTFDEHEFILKPGDKLFIYTDGVTEAMNTQRELFGTDRMVLALNEAKDQGPREVLEKVMEKIREFSAGADQFDDITMLCLEYNGPRGEKNHE